MISPLLFAAETTKLPSGAKIIKKILISFYSFIDGLAFTTGEIGTALLIASFTGVVIQATFLTTVRKLNRFLTIVIKF